MPYNFDPLDPAYQPQPEAAPSGAPPQFNESCCGYRCGWGCCEPSEGDSESDGDGDGNDRSSERTSGSTTVVGSERQNELLEQAVQRGNFVVMGTPRPAGLPILGEIERGTGMVILTNGNHHIVISPQDSPYIRSPNLRAYHEIENSLLPEPSSGYMTNASRSRGVPSPRSPGLGVPGWWEGQDRPYLFRTPPLRLNSQCGRNDHQTDALMATADVDTLRSFLEHWHVLYAARTDGFH